MTTHQKENNYSFHYSEKISVSGRQVLVLLLPELYMSYLHFIFFASSTAAREAIARSSAKWSNCSTLSASGEHHCSLFLSCSGYASQISHNFCIISFSADLLMGGKLSNMYTALRYPFFAA